MQETTFKSVDWALHGVTKKDSASTGLFLELEPQLGERLESTWKLRGFLPGAVADPPFVYFPLGPSELARCSLSESVPHVRLALPQGARATDIAFVSPYLVVLDENGPALHVALYPHRMEPRWRSLALEAEVTASSRLGSAHWSRLVVSCPEKETVTVVSHGALKLGFDAQMASVSSSTRIPVQGLVGPAVFDRFADGVVAVVARSGINGLVLVREDGSQGPFWPLRQSSQVLNIIPIGTLLDTVKMTPTALKHRAGYLLAQSTSPFLEKIYPDLPDKPRAMDLHLLLGGKAAGGLGPPQVFFNPVGQGLVVWVPGLRALLALSRAGQLIPLHGALDVAS